MAKSTTKIVKRQVLLAFERLGWNPDDFVVGTDDQDIIVIRIVDQQRVIIPVSKVKTKCVEDNCCKWIKKLERLIREGFAVEPDCQLIIPVVATSRIPQGSKSLAAASPQVRSRALAAVNPTPGFIPQRNTLIKQSDHRIIKATRSPLTIQKLNGVDRVTEIGPQQIDGLDFGKFSDGVQSLPGSIINFTIYIENYSSTESFFIETVSDQSDSLPGTFISIPEGAQRTISGFILVLNRLFAPGESLFINSSFQVATDAIFGFYENRATLTLSISVPLEARSTVRIIGLALEKTSDRQIALRGQNITFTISIRNITTDIDYFIDNIVDSVDPGTGTFISIPEGAVPTADGFVLNYNQVLNPGQSLTAVSVLQISSTAAFRIHANLARLMARGFFEITSTVPFMVVESIPVEIVIEKVADRQAVLLGETIGFTTTIRNISTNRFFMVEFIQDQLDPILGRFTSIPPGAISTDNGFILNYNRLLGPGETLISNSSFQIAPTAVIGNVANQVGMRVTDLPLIETFAPFTIEGIVLTKFADNPIIAPGEVTTFTIRISNISSVNVILNGTLSDFIIPSNVGAFFIVPPGATPGSSSFSFGINQTIPAGQSITFTASLRASQSAVATNYVNNASLATNLYSLETSYTFTVSTGWILRTITRGSDISASKTRVGLGPMKSALTQGIVVTHDYTDIFRGFSFNGTEEDVARLRAEFPDSIITRDIVAPLSEFDNSGPFVPIKRQEVGAFIERTGASHSSQYQNDLQNRTDINVFIIDTGIFPHIDLNVVGGINVSQPGENEDWVDRNGHGTHVAGIVGALNNRLGIVGIAPGVRLWAIKTVADDGTASLSNALAGMDWILRNRNVLWSGLGVLNVSLNIRRDETVDYVVDVITSNGLPVVAKAGDSASMVQFFSPAGSPGAITVGSTGPHPCYSTLSNFSNIGPEIDLLASGECILSTLPENKYGIRTGTSTSAPMVTGTIALLFSTGKITGTGTEFVNAIRNTLVCTSKEIKQRNADGTKDCNPRINVKGKPVTDVSVWAGVY